MGDRRFKISRGRKIVEAALDARAQTRRGGAGFISRQQEHRGHSKMKNAESRKMFCCPANRAPQGRKAAGEGMASLLQMFFGGNRFTYDSGLEKCL